MSLQVGNRQQGEQWDKGAGSSEPRPKEPQRTISDSLERGGLNIDPKALGEEVGPQRLSSENRNDHTALVGWQSGHRASAW